MEGRNLGSCTCKPASLNGLHGSFDTYNWINWLKVSFKGKALKLVSVCESRLCELMRDGPKIKEGQTESSKKNLTQTSADYFSGREEPLLFMSANYKPLSLLKAPILAAIHWGPIVWFGGRTAATQGL